MTIPTNLHPAHWTRSRWYVSQGSGLVLLRIKRFPAHHHCVCFPQWSAKIYRFLKNLYCPRASVKWRWGIIIRDPKRHYKCRANYASVSCHAGPRSCHRRWTPGSSLNRMKSFVDPSGNRSVLAGFPFIIIAFHFLMAWCPYKYSHFLKFPNGVLEFQHGHCHRRSSLINLA